VIIAGLRLIVAAEQIVAREPRGRVSQDAFLIQRGRYRPAA